MISEQVFDTSQKLRSFIPVLISGIIVWMCIDALGPIDIAASLPILIDIAPHKWALAGLFAYISFKAVSRYDPLVAGHLGLDISFQQAEKIGWRTTAIAQLAGAGLFTGTFLRWKQLGKIESYQSDNALKDAALLTGAVTSTFFYGCALVTGATVICAAFAGIVPGVFAVAVAFLAVIVLAVSRLTASKRARFPSISFSLRAFAFTAVDTIFAAAIFYIFLPSTFDSFLAIYLIFLVSLSIGMISGLPGGVGAFEVAMLYLLPEAAPSDLIPAFLAFRVIYYVLPTLVAAFSLTFDKNTNRPQAGSFVDTTAIPKFLAKLPELGADLVCQNQMRIFSCKENNTSALISTSKSTDIVFKAPIGDRLDLSASVSSLLAHAASRGKALCIYQCNATTAKIARHAGMRDFKFSTEAVVKTSSFDLKDPEYAKLRRKLRQALKQGISINTNHYDISDLRSINMSWIGLHGREHGFSTGRFSKSLISKQRVYVAFQSSRPVAFVTFSTSTHGWTLDLIRHNPKCPSGTIFSLIAQAIDDARESGVKQVSLGCVPLAPETHTAAVFGIVFKTIFNRSKGLKGLHQFKRVFNPIWKDRFIAISSFRQLPLIAISLFAQIHRPPKLEEN